MARTNKSIISEAMRLLGSRTSQKKAKSSAENGKKGGRPPKSGVARCFACDRALGKNPKLVDTRDDQTVYVGRECYKLVVAAGEAGYQPPIGGPKLWVLRAD